MRSHVRCILRVYFFYHHHHMMRMALTRSALRDYSASAAAATTTRPSGSHVWRTEGAMNGRNFAKSHISRKSSASSPCFCQCTGKAGTSSAAIAPSILHSSMQCSRPRPCNSRPCARAPPRYWQCSAARLHRDTQHPPVLHHVLQLLLFQIQSVVPGAVCGRRIHTNCQ
jgi:hypothetical protein